ncbi:kielin/chordin-like protein [Helicoverpa zea]|uniref:kielin/chordin-like protein n=1 Tax=Helicoverpa zea TaxID=7113 RepID=UPI001F563A0F|nr:kielin/chordin-like protein [Helicoverpa zea]
MINDLPKIVIKAKCLLFADDLKLSLAITDEQDCEVLQEDIDRVVNWNNQKPRKVCEEGTTRLVDTCNSCYCHKGREYCENNICEEVERILYTQACTEGDKRQLDECTNCFCHGLTKWACLRYCETRKPELPPTLPPTPPSCTLSPKPSTKPSTVPTTTETPKKQVRFYDEKGQPIFMITKNSYPCVDETLHVIDSCNACYCKFKKWYCGEIHCVPDKNKKPPVSAKCPLGKQFPLGVSWRCHCLNVNQQKYNCKIERKNVVAATVCPKEKKWDPKICKGGKPKPCEVDTTFLLDACNFCVCHNKAYSCTQVDCSKIKRRSGRCVEGHKYYLADSCNFCICQGGQEFCTSRPCLPNADAQLQGGSTSRAVASPERQLGTCVDYEEVLSDGACNTCICLHGRKICTMTHCTDRTADWTTRLAAAHNHIQYKTRNAACPKGTFIHNPNQPCSICLCGGNDPGSHNMCFTDAECVKQDISHLNG